jgi:membrane fusion protein (multidrug efflux system)
MFGKIVPLASARKQSAAKSDRFDSTDEIDTRVLQSDDLLPAAESGLFPRFVSSVTRFEKRRLMYVLAAVPALLLLVLGGVRLWRFAWSAESTDDAIIGGDVSVIAPKIAGLIEQVAIADNQTVHAGELLLKIDDRDYRAALAKASALVDERRAVIANLDATCRLQEAVITRSRAGLYEAHAEASRVDAARARGAVEAAERELAVIESKKRQAEAALAAAEADKSIAKLNLESTELRSPIDGIVGNRTARRGMYATVGAQLVSIVPTEGLWVDANFKEKQLASIRPGMGARISVDALHGEVLEGRVVSVAPAKLVQRVPVRIALDQDSARLGRLRPGFSVSVEIDDRPQPAMNTVRAPKPAVPAPIVKTL